MSVVVIRREWEEGAGKITCTILLFVSLQFIFIFDFPTISITRGKMHEDTVLKIYNLSEEILSTCL